ncbi:violaxanthin de-epoxidase, chloroplastic [Tanacetum coccineum]
MHPSLYPYAVNLVVLCPFLRFPLTDSQQSPHLSDLYFITLFGRVKRGKVAGTFYFSVLDNGVVSNEYWTTVDVSEDFSWGLFHYSGAARVAGQSYTGAVLVSPNGEYPNETEKERLVSALDRCCIKEWELFDVDNCQCNDPPLGLREGSHFTTTLTAIPSDILGDSPATSRWGYLSLATCRGGIVAREHSLGIRSPATIPSDKVGPTYFSVK